MSKKDRQSAQPEAPDSTVTLTPILGVRPGQYLTAIYVVALALIVFFLLLYPGIRNPGSYVTVDVRPGFAPIKVDGVFAGTAPGTVFVKRGKRRIEVSRTFFQGSSQEVDVRGRVFATLLFPSRMKLSFTLSVSDLDGLVKHSLDDFSQNPYIPRVLSDTAWAAFGAPSGTVDEARSRLWGFVNDSLFFVNPALDASASTSTAEDQLAELLKASARIATSGGFLTPSTFLSLVRQGLIIKEKYDNSPAWLLLALSRDHAKAIASSTWIASHFTSYRDALSRYYQANLSTAGIGDGGAVAVMGGMGFRSIPRGVLVMGRDDNLESLGKSIDLLLPHPVETAPFFLSETEVTNAQFLAFIEDSPPWRPSNRDSLVTQGLVSDTYLSGWADDRPPSGSAELPVVNVSYDAARAYCDWLTRRIQGQYPAAVARLPSEAEWEWAARGGLRGMPYPLGARPGNAVFFQTGISGPSRAGSSEPNGYGLRDMVGNVWEWCADSFGPSDYLLSSLDPRANADLIPRHPVARNKAVRGGSWNNQRDIIRVYTRGSQPEDWCTPFLGFRVAVSRP